MIDLHCHSNFSDGALNPAELICKAGNQKLRLLSLTDHDTVSGYPDLCRAAAKTLIKIIPGIELSALWKKHEVHILGYQINHGNSLSALINHQNLCRIERAHKIGDLLSSLGISKAYNKACLIAGHERVGRPHFAQLLVNEGKARDSNIAFKQFLGRSKIAYVPTSWITLQDAVKGIVESGGQAVIAHPLKYGLTRTKLHTLVGEFKQAGGIGIEVVSGEMTISEINEMASLSLKFHLLASSGSDYHNDSTSRVTLGAQKELPINCMPIWHKWDI